MEKIVKLSAVVFALLLFAACSSGPITKGNGKIETVKRKVTSFNKVTVQGDLDVILTAGKSQKISITGDSNVIPFVTTEVNDNTLQIAIQQNANIKPSQRPVITIRAKQIGKVSTGGAVRMQVKNLANKLFVMTSSGSSDISMTGKSSNLTINTNGSANIKAMGLEANNIKVNVAGSGNVTVFANKKLEVQISGSGEVSYAGKAAITEKVDGAGAIKHVKSVLK